MRRRGEITVFLSLVMVCVLSLFLGLVESARTTGARLYMEMAANSSMASVMSQYNRNVWDMYHLLFLESESDEAVEASFASYLGFYLEQDNLYPMEIKEVNVTGKTGMSENGGLALEQDILSYIIYRLPDVAVDLAGMTAVAADAAKTGDFQELSEVCHQVGKRTQKLEKRRMESEDALRELREILDEMTEAVEEEKEGKFRKHAEAFEEGVREFPELTDAYENEVQGVSEYLMELISERESGIAEAGAKVTMEQEILAYEQVVSSAGEQLETFQKIGEELEEGLKWVEQAVDELDEALIEEGTEQEPDWGQVRKDLDLVIVPKGTEQGEIDSEKALALDRLEELVHGNLLSLVLPEGKELSDKRVELRGIPSSETGKRKLLELKTERNGEMESAKEESGLLDQCMINEYCFLSFDSFLETCTRDLEPVDQPLLYEQEYLLCGKNSDKENLNETVEQLLAVRGAMNLLFLLQSPERKAEADGLAAAISGGNAPVQFVYSFFILVLWAMGEAIWDLRVLLMNGTVPFWKCENEWEMGMNDLLALKFLDPVETIHDNGQNYQDYMRILFFLMNKEDRNYRMMDLIQWNVQTVQEDFLIADCATNIEIQADVEEQHLFVTKTSYNRTVKVTGKY